MIRQCAWCGEILGEAPPWDDLSVTHGICVACDRAVKEKEKDGAAPRGRVPEDMPPMFLLFGRKFP